MKQSITLYGISNCDTVKKARAWLAQHQVNAQFHDFKKQGVAGDRVDHWLATAGWEKLLNTRGMMWRKLSEEQRADVDEKKALALMAEYPSLIKRPVLDTGKALLVGFDEASYEKLK